VNLPQPAASSATLRQLADLAEIRGDGTESAELRRTAGALDADTRPRLDPAKPASEADLVLRAARARIPWLLRRLIEAGVTRTSEAATLARHGIATLADLSHALDEGRIARVLDREAASRLNSAIDGLSAEAKPFTLGRASELLELLQTRLMLDCPSFEKVTAAGGVRRFEPLVDSLTIVGSTADPQAVLDTIARLPEIDDVLHRSARRAIVTFNHVEVDVRVAAPDEYGTVLYSATGSRAHLAGMAARRTRVRLYAREEDVYADAGLPFIPAELRQGTGEIEAATLAELPALVDVKDIRGDLHMHSIYSDGQDSLSTMVAAANALGYEYIAITDHSQRAAASRTLTLETLARQRDEVARLREQYPAMVIFHGVEVDIMPDGRLDFSDDVLATLDIVIASLHEDAGQGARALTRRCLAAIRHPLVTIISHPANRIVGRRGGYPLDFGAIYEAAVETGTALEIDGAPAHLDMDGEHAREAVAAGVTVTIDGDCHRATSLARHMRFGVGTARRGWVEPRHVLNTRRLTDVRRFIAAKRPRA
jgi:DNA polymerase (family X)